MVDYLADVEVLVSVEGERNAVCLVRRYSHGTNNTETVRLGAGNAGSVTGEETTQVTPYRGPCPS